jgi:UDP-glucose 4-epimerase
MKIFVTGGAGFIGSHLVDRLSREAGAEVVVFDNFRRGLGAVPRGVKVVRGDVRDAATLTQAMSGCKIVYHLAAQSNVIGAIQDVRYSFTTNVAGTFEVFQAAQDAGAQRVVFTSSREIYGEAPGLPVSEDTPCRPKNAYGASKLAGELYAEVFRKSGLDVNVLRLANVYGPGDRSRVIPIFFDQARRGESITIFGGKQVIDFVWIDTVVDVLLQAGFGAALGGPVNIGSGTGSTLQELAHRILEISGSSSEIFVSPARAEETTRFIADIRRATECFGIRQELEPLRYLSALDERAVALGVR